ncbi:MAG: DUF4160 domain-containing protein, partial [Ilumatobacteraceae bacterium]
HFHAGYSGQEAQRLIESGEVVQGDLPPHAKRMVAMRAACESPLPMASQVTSTWPQA